MPYRSEAPPTASAAYGLDLVHDEQRAGALGLFPKHSEPLGVWLAHDERLEHHGGEPVTSGSDQLPRRPGSLNGSS